MCGFFWLAMWSEGVFIVVLKRGLLAKRKVLYYLFFERFMQYWHLAKNDVTWNLICWSVLLLENPLDLNPIVELESGYEKGFSGR